MSARRAGIAPVFLRKATLQGADTSFDGALACRDGLSSRSGRRAASHEE